jgi:hypothetical protein
VVKVQKVEDAEQAKRYGVEVGTALLVYDFVLVTEQAARDLRRWKAEEAMAGYGGKFKFVDDLPVPDVD